MEKQPKVIDLIQHVDDRGYLYEIIHGSDDFMDKFGQVYVVGNPARGAIRAFHAHDELVDYFHIVKGSAKFVLFKREEGTEINPDKSQVFVLTERKPQLLIVPSGWYHGWMSLEDNTTMISTSNREYNKDNPDEHRISPYVLGEDIWKVKAK